MQSNWTSGLTKIEENYIGKNKRSSLPAYLQYETKEKKRVSVCSLNQI